MPFQKLTKKKRQIGTPPFNQWWFLRRRAEEFAFKYSEQYSIRELARHFDRPAQFVMKIRDWLTQDEMVNAIGEGRWDIVESLVFKQYPNLRDFPETRVCLDDYDAYKKSRFYRALSTRKVARVGECEDEEGHQIHAKGTPRQTPSTGQESVGIGSEKEPPVIAGASSPKEANSPPVTPPVTEQVPPVVPSWGKSQYGGKR